MQAAPPVVIVAVLGGLGAALAWTVSTVCSSRSSRIIDPASVVAWVMAAGLVIAGPVALLSGIPSRLAHGAGAWLALAGAGNVAGLLFAYAGMRIGQVALVAPLVSTEGAVAALIAILAGEAIAPSTAVTLAAIACAVLLAAVPDPGAERAHSPSHARAVAFAGLAALSFGASLYAAGRAGASLPAAWVAAAARIVGVPALTLPLAAAGRLRLDRRAIPLILAAAFAEVLGFYAYSAGARHGIAVAAVLSSQFGSFSALAGFAVFGERLRWWQAVGVAAALAGVGVLSALRS